MTAAPVPNLVGPALRGADPDPVLAGSGHTFASVTERISDAVLKRPTGRLWFAAFGITFLLVMLLVTAVSYLLLRGVGIWGIDIPVAWGFAIVNFVWWIGIGHAGTFISAMLLLMRQNWRTSINRFAEAMTLFAVACAGMFPLLHLGRPRYFYWLIPYPNSMLLWPQFRSALVWDVFAVSTYGLVSLLFWYVGLVPDVAALRDRATHRAARVIYGVMALGWTGASRHWTRYQTAYLLLAGLAAPLVISVHSIVGMDFAEAQVQGWHSTIFPPYFVAGAIFSGFAMVLNLGIPLRWALKLKDFITIRHIDNCGKLMLVTGLIVAYGYMQELYMGWYSGNVYESFMNLNRLIGPYAWAYWVLMFCNVLTPQFLWFRRVRRSVPLMFLLALVVQVGMWTERFVIVVTSLHRDFLPSSWGMYYPTFWDYATLAGTIGLFLCFFLLFVRFLPSIAMSEMRELVHSTGAAPTRRFQWSPAVPSEMDSSTGPFAPLPPERLFGLAAMFDQPKTVRAAARKVMAAGYSRAEAFTPFPVEGLSAALGYQRTRVPLVVLTGGILGGVGGFFMMWYANVVSYPWDIGGRPPNSWPAFIPITFELTILGAALAAVFGTLAMNRLPKLYNPIFNTPAFERSTSDRFFLCVEATDPKFDQFLTREFLKTLDPLMVVEVPK